MSRIIPDPISLQADTLPPQTDVVVIGGGIVGICTALYLSRKNVRVVVCEKGLIGAAQNALGDITSSLTRMNQLIQVVGDPANAASDGSHTGSRAGIHPWGR